MGGYRPINMEYIDIIMFSVFILVTLIKLPFIHFCVKYLPFMFAQKELIKLKQEI